jgi:excisionase family DNA binding protein
LIARHDLDAFLRDEPLLPGLTEDDLDDLRLITAKQAADIAQVHLHTLQRWVARGELRAVRQRPKVLIAREDLDEFLSNRVPPPQGFAAAYEARAEDDASRPLTAKQAADIANVHPSSVRIWVREGKLEAVEQQPLILIDPATLEAFLRDRDRASLRRVPAEEMVEVWRPEDQAHDTDDPVPDEEAMLDVLRMPAVDTPKDEVWRTLVLAQQREIEAAKAREARLLNLLDQATQPTPRTPQRVKVSEMTLVHKVKRYLESVGRPQRAWQVQQALKLDKPPHRELSRLYGRGEIRRLRDGIYAALDQSPR